LVDGLGISGGISLAEALGQKKLAAIFIATIFMIGAAIFNATLVIATAQFAAVFPAKLGVVVITRAVFNISIGIGFVGIVVGGKVVAGRGVPGNSLIARFGSCDHGGFRSRGRGLRHISIGIGTGLPGLISAQSREIVGYRFFLVKPDLAGVGADETFIEDAAGELVEVFVFEGAQHAGADFRGVGDGIEFDAAQLPLLAKFFSEGAHHWLRYSFTRI